MKIYVVDNGGQWTHREWRVLKYLGVDSKIIPNTVPVKEIDADGLVLSGGAPRIGWDVPKLGNVGDYLDQLKIPILGICVAHQFIAIHFGGKAGPAKTPEFGKAEIFIEDQNDLLKGLPEKFVAWESHNDEIKSLPKTIINLARSNNCLFQAIKHRSRPVYGLQFHPEVENTEYGYEIFRNFVKVCESYTKS
jgi:GMP synthase (glutamine-hydrolysing)